MVIQIYDSDDLKCAYQQGRADVINNFVNNAMSEFKKFEAEHGYPTLGDIELILGDVAEGLKEKCKTNDARHGYWYLLDDCTNAGVYCSECYKKVYRVEYANQKIKSKYCPNCGAIMDLEGEE